MKDESVIAQFLKTAALTPDRLAIVQDDRSVTYGELLLLARRYASVMSAIQSEQPVALHLKRSPSLVAALLGALLVQKTFVALDPNQPELRKQVILEQADPCLVLTDDDVLQIESLPIESCQDKNMPIDDDHIAYLLFTSGSTGKPKGIAIKNSAITALVKWAHAYYRPEQLSRVLFSTTITFDLSMFELFVPLSAGHSIRIADNVLDLITKPQKFHDITLINTVPSAIREVLRCKALPKQAIHINLAGEALTWDLVDTLYEQPQTQSVYNLWGPSEDTTYSSYYYCPKNSVNRTGNSVPIGTSLTGSELLIIDENFNSASEGEICITGNKLAAGYYQNPTLTARQFIKHPVTGKRLYRTGDLGRIDADGMIHFKGRLDFQVKVNGYRIELEEIEAVLLKLDSVSEVVVATTNAPDTKLIAAVRVTDLTPKTEAELVAHLLKYCPQYMCPSLWGLTTQPLPKSPNGKLARSGIEAFVQQHGPHNAQKEETDNPLLSLTQRILQKECDPNLSFTRNGGKSLQATRLFAEISEQWQHDIKLTELLDGRQSIAILATRLTQKQLSEIQTASYDELQTSAAERRLWQVSQTHPKPAAYNVAIRFDIDGEYDEARLLTAIKTVIQRSGLMVQYTVVDSKVNKTLSRHAIDVCRDHTKEKSLLDLPFDLEHGCLVRVGLFAHQNNSQLLFVAPHVLIDGFGLEALFTAISRYYQDESFTKINVTRFALPSDCQHDMKIFYNDACAQPVAYNWPALSHNATENHCTEFSLSVNEVNALFANATQCDTTVPALALSLLRATLYQLGLGDDLWIAVPYANRINESEMGYIGNVINTLPIRQQVARQHSIHSIQEEDKNQLHQALAWQTSDYAPADDSCYQVIFSPMEFAANALSLPGCKISRHFPAQPAAKSPLIVSMITTTEGGILVRLESQSQFIEKEQLEVYAQYYQRALTLEYSNYGLTLSHLSLATEAQAALCLQSLQPAQSYGKTHSIVDSIREVVHRQPHHIALVDNNKEITYQQLWQSATQVAVALQEKGTCIGKPVGVAMQRSWQLIATLLGILRAGAHYVPLDPRNPLKRTQQILNVAQPVCVITDQSDLETSLFTLNWDEIENMTADEICLPTHIPADSLAYVLFTSGTTGEPKGVQITHHNVVRLISSCQEWADLSHHDTWTLFHSYAFDFSVWEMFGCFFTGGKLVIVSSETCADANAFYHLLLEHRVSVLSQTPTAFRNLMSIEKKLPNPPRYIVYGGEALLKSDLKAWWDRYGSKGTKHINMYGITEITVHATYHEMTPESNDNSIGKPLSDLGLLCVTATGFSCPANLPGELIVTGAGLSTGYLKQQQLTAEKFQQFHYADSTYNIYKSGDLACLRSHGEFSYHGRIDKQLKINGHRIEAGELTNALTSFEKVEDAYFIVTKSEEGLSQLLCYYLSQQAYAEKALEAHMVKHCPPYAIPSHFIHMIQYPMTVNGKIDESKLPTPAEESHDLPEMAPLDDVQTALMQIWAKLLKQERIDTNRSFFEQGGTSLKALRLVKDINRHWRETKKLVNVVDIFRYPTLAEQINIISQRLEAGVKNA